MADISAKQVKELRDMTGVGMMECKKALVETSGDIDGAIKILRERGQAMAVKKADRAANQGLVAAATSEDGHTGALVVVNCETDFVAKNDSFQAFVNDMAERALVTEDGQLAEAAKDDLGMKVAEIGENLVISDNRRYVVDGTGTVANYIHLGAQVGVLMELGFEKAETRDSAEFQQLAKDLCMHVAATSPQGIRREDIPQELIDAEREIFAKQVEGKPAEIIDKIVDGKINKFYSQVCMLEQGFVKDPDTAVKALIEQVGTSVGDTIELKRFMRLQIGG